ncbi:MmpS family transport accessory protein [Micromonospora sp. NPDC051006]|uniref:MmpS family transport accessory protein n=1 Tax=Micromonospora sp. NPDC051006 TaxID=3364283 RepID=UPI00378E77BC
MSEVSPSGDPTPSTGPAPGPWAPPDPGVGSGNPGYGPPPTVPTPPAGTVPPAGWGAPGTVAPGGQSPYGNPWPYAQPTAPPARSGSRPGAVGAIIGAAVVLVLVICGALGVVALRRYAEVPGPSGPIADEPYSDPYYDAEDGDEEDEDAPWASEPALAPSGEPGTIQVRYEVTGDGPVDLEYYDANGDFVQDARVALPWRLTLRVNDAGRVMVLAHNSADEGPVACKITVDGKTVDEVSAPKWGASCFG